MKVKFLPSGQELEIKPNQSVMDLAHENGIHIQSVCKGVPSCAECRVQVKRGEHNLIPPSQVELSLIGTAQFVDNSRLACQMRCFGDVEVDLTEQIEKEKRVTGTKRPRGGKKLEGEESRAVAGSLVLDEGGKYSDTDEKIAEKILITEQIKLAKNRLRHGGKEKGENPQQKSSSAESGNKPKSESAGGGKRRRRRRGKKNKKPKSN